MAVNDNPEQGLEAHADDVPSLLPVLVDLITRAKTLLCELEEFRARLRSLRQSANVAPFASSINAELNMLERFSQKADDDSATSKSSQIAKCSNIPYLEAIWSMVKKSRNVITIQNRIYTCSSKAFSQGMRHVPLNSLPPGTQEGSVTVDAITDSGKTWTKVSLVNNRRLIFDLAKQGWDSGGSDYGNECDLSPPGDDDDFDVQLVKTAKDLTKAAQLFRVRTQKPVVHLVLPRVEYGQTPEVDSIIDKCRVAGAVVSCGEDLQPAPPLDEAIKSMISDPLTSFSDVLNMDCTILLALVSDFSHAQVSEKPWFHPGLVQQVETEKHENLLPSLLYPAIGSHKQVCTREALDRMREIVDTIGTPSEKARTTILFGDNKEKTQPQLVRGMQDLSAYPVSSEWQLPVQVVDFDVTYIDNNAPAEARNVCANMTAINRSIFLFGWTNSYTTITSNRTVLKQIENDLEEYASLPDDAWPKIWLCPIARSLVGKEKRSAPKDSKREDDAGHAPGPRNIENGMEVLSIEERDESEDHRFHGHRCEEATGEKNALAR